MIASMRREDSKRVEAPISLSYKQLFFCNYVGNLTGIYDVNYFGKITISSIRKDKIGCWLTILKKIKVAKPFLKAWFYRIRENSISTSKIDLIKYNFTVYRRFHGFTLPLSLTWWFFIYAISLKPHYIKKIKASI
jgi:hypothetical protein